MGHIGGELFVRVDPVVKGRNHAAQRSRKAADFVRASGQVRNTYAPRAEPTAVFLASNFGGRGQIAQRIGDGRGQNETKPDTDQNGDDEHLIDLFALFAHKIVDLTCGAGYCDDTNGVAVFLNRCGHRKDRAAEQVGDLLHIGPAQCGRRDKRGRKLESFAKFQAQQAGIFVDNEEAGMVWGKGLAQEEELEKEKEELSRLSEAPFARSRDDERMNAELRQRERWGDPFLKMMRKKKKRNFLYLCV